MMCTLQPSNTSITIDQISISTSLGTLGEYVCVCVCVCVCDICVKVKRSCYTMYQNHTKVESDT